MHAKCFLGVKLLYARVSLTHAVTRSQKLFFCLPYMIQYNSYKITVVLQEMSLTKSDSHWCIFVYILAYILR